jgi:RNA 2',3'-cyclic 3'-phosphodiesterase
MSWRCFVGITLPHDLKELLIENQQPFTNILEGHFSPSQNLHLTLKYIGDITQENYEIMSQALHELQYPKFNMHLDKFGCFKTGTVVNTIWAGIHGSEELQQNIEGILSNFAFVPKAYRRFNPHITLIRPKSYINCTTQTIQEEINAINEKRSTYEFQVEEFHIFKSTLQQGSAPVYEIMDTISLV